MELKPPRKLDGYVATDTSDVRATLVWKGVAARLETPRRGVRAWQLGLGTVAAAAAIVAVLATRPNHPAGVHAAAQAPVEYRSGLMTLADGSRILLHDEGRARVDRFDASVVEVSLEQGAADFEIVHAPGRSFVVHAGTFDVVDVGTRFTASLEGGLRITVSEGRVEVHDQANTLPVRTLVAGESWVSVVGPSAVVTGSEVASAALAPAVTHPSAVPHELSAKELVEQADAARLAGHVDRAAALLDDVRRRHRADARAGVAAFQLGRLRLDALENPQGAVEAFDDAIALSPRAPFREDAEARRVEALERAHDPRCSEARDTYLTRYPSGIHVTEVSGRCVP